MRNIFCFATLLIPVLALASLEAQTPAPVIMQAASSVPAGPAASRAASSTAAADSKDLTQLLQEMQATNAATIKKQEAALETLDALQKAAEELKIFSKRG
jgi:hypothetical protein